MTDNINDSEIRYLRRKVLEWGRANFKEFPWRHLSNQWHSLVAEIMLQRTKADQVEPVFLDFIERYPIPEAYLADTDSNVFDHLGLPQRREWLKSLARELVSNDIPLNRDDLLKLPGVGDYIASAFRSLHMNVHDRIIDSNVVRFYGRFFGFDTHGETRRKKWFIQLAERITPERVHRDYNYALLDFSMTICTPVPQCPDCPLRRKCNFYKTTD